MSRPFIVFANGCFDILHTGHYNFLMHCSWIADGHRCRKNSDAKFIVAIDSDKKIRQDKGKERPIFTQDERAEALLSIRYKRRTNRGYIERPIIDEVRFFDSNEELEQLIQELMPDCMVKAESWRGNVVGAKYVPNIYYYSDKDSPFSTTRTVDRIKKNVKRK